MGMIPELPVAMLACTRIGAPFTVVFGGFSGESLSGRLNDMQCELLITQDEGWRRGNRVPLKANADAALDDSPTVKRCVVVKRTGGDVQMKQGRDVWADEMLRGRERRPASRAPASRWTRRTCSTCCTRAARPPSPRASSTRPAGTSSACRRRTTTSSTSSRTRSTGAPPTSAGSPGTATSSSGRWPTRRPASSTRARPTSPTRTAGGRSSSATSPTSSTRRRPPSAPT